MADKRFRGRDKIVQKMTKDGLVEENLRTGETKSAVAEEPPKQEDSEKDAAESAEETPVVEEDVCMDAEDGEEEKPRRSTAKQSTEYYKAHQEDGKPKEKDAPPVDEDAEPAPKKKGRLSFDDEQQGGIVRGAGLGIKKVAKKGVDTATGFAHNKVHQVEKENSGVESAHKSEETLEGLYRFSKGRKKTREKSARAEKKVEAEKKSSRLKFSENEGGITEEAAEMPLKKKPPQPPPTAAGGEATKTVGSKFYQKKQYKDAYAAAKRGQKAGNAASKQAATAANTLAEKAKAAVQEVVVQNKTLWAGLGIAALMLMLIMGAFSSCSAAIHGTGSTFIGTTYPSKDADMKGAEEDYHLDCPWKPSDLEQQEGRILRQGNRNQKVKIFRYVTENTFDSYMWQILENKQKFISQIMTSKSPVRACDDVDDTALTYAEIKALATGNPYIKEKMDLDIQVSKLKLMRANHTSQIYSLESDIARRYPAEITAAKERIAGLKADLAVAKPLLEQDKEKFSITVEDRVYTDRKEAGSAILAACAAMKIAKTEGQIADLGGFAISSRFDAFAQTFKLTIKRQSSYTIELGSDPAGNIQRILNALASIEKTLPQVERRLETLQQQLAEAKEEVQRPFPQEAELNEKSARLAELNALLDMDEKGDDAALGMDEEVTDSELPAPKREIERSADSVKRPSILAQLHEKQAERIAEPKPQKKKSHGMEL